MSTETYRLPDFLTLLPKKPGGEINPHFKEIETEFNAWGEKKLQSGHLAEIVYKAEIPLFVSLTCPTLSHEQSMGVVNICTVAFMADDMSERLPSHQLTGLSRLCMKALRDAKENIQNPFVKMMGFDLMSIAKAVGGPSHWPKFIDEVEKMTTHLIQEVRDREVSMNANVPLDIRSYLIRRSWTAGARPVFALLRSTRFPYIPDNVLANAIIQEMENSVAEMLVISNDIFSFKEEYENGVAFTNILTIMEKDLETAHLGLDLQQRLDYASGLFKAALERFYASRRDLSSFNSETDQHLTLYADGLLDMVIGNLQWSRVCRRYNVFMSEEDRENNIMQLAL